MSDGFTGDQATIYIVDNGTDPSTGLTTSLSGDITSFKESGGEQDRDSVVTFGGNISKKKNRTELEVSFDVVFRWDASDRTFWDKLKWGTGLTSAGDAPSKDIYIQWSDGTNYYTRAYRDCYAIKFEPEQSADDVLKGTVTFNLTPTDASGNANFKIVETAASSITW